MDELILRILAIEARLDALKPVLNADQMIAYSVSVDEAKSKALKLHAASDSKSLKLIETFYR